MKKTLLTLVALLVIGFQFAGAQTYEVEYSGKYSSETINKLFEIMFKDNKVPSGLIDEIDTVQLRKDFEDMVFAEKTTMSRYKMKSETDTLKTHAVYHSMGMTFDMNNMPLVSLAEDYYDGITNETYKGIFNKVDKVKYLVKMPEQKNNPVKEVEGSKTILGHECKIMEIEQVTADLSDLDIPELKDTSVTSKMKVWYATDIPFEMEGDYKGVPGLVLGYETDMDGVNVLMFATSIKKTDKEITRPEGKVITLKEYSDIMKKWDIKKTK